MIDANRRMPDLSPSASASACPSAMPQSSTVWWPSTCRSPLHVTSRSQPACLPSCCSMWSKNGMPVSARRRPRSVEVQLDGDVGLLRRCGATLAVRLVLMRRTSRRLVEEQIDLVLRAGRDAQRVRHDGASGRARARPDRAAPARPRRRRGARAARTARSSRRSGTPSRPASRRARARCGRAGPGSRRAARWLRTAWRSATIPAAWVSADMWYGSRTRCRSATTSGLVKHVPEPRARHRERLRERAHDGDVRVVGDELQRALAAELDVGLVDARRARPCGRRARRPPRAAARCRSGCWASRRRRRPARRRAPRRSPRRRARTAASSLSWTSSVCVSHERRECSRYVGSNTIARCPGPP